MTNSLFLQSQSPDPYAIYIQRLAESPVLWDAGNKLWAVYDYRSCREVLANTAGQIPPVLTEGLSDYALAISGRLVRISNNPAHGTTRPAAMVLMRCMKEPPVQGIMHDLLSKPGSGMEIDWVDKVGKHLPLLSTLGAFEVKGAEADFIVHNMGAVLKIMKPVKTGEDIAAINSVSKDMYCLLEKHILQKGFLTDAVNTVASSCSIPKEEALALCVSNMTGLLIQGYDAISGLLSNSLLHLLRYESLRPFNNMDDDYLQRAVLEVLRFDPPVHNTRRVTGEAMVLGDHTIEKGQTVLVVMAAANRDPQQFVHPNHYDSARLNNATHLTFGSGPHACVGNWLSTHITTEALSYLFQHYRHIQLIDPNIDYEPLVNLRLPKKVLISLSN
jgi:cytochrome P450